ncbi:PTS glucitol/sorbitol transporter subunit IIA [Helcobacillus sp. ACRRO]|uniref:PTS glucitol/sorbitol transporter subunit IIA n=1 Tax=Helcobacillus sp. ACRRO TaxID=2918202 RepID=UPI001EF4331F|nr:PTS glucitol/sorbitol transporter subunit IIA [Helcobacillus sp. ACRRO]MCG7428037.1 PTS glucitol/sorbitol transporter subunit IIA [Helcobacillus sp. ACRRO]
MSALWTTTVSSIGSDAQDMFEAGVFILFGEPVPPALADVSIVHRDASSAARDIAPGDVFLVGDERYTIDEVGEIANSNLTELGHVVVYVNQPDQELLPGAILASGADPVTPAVGTRISFTEQ